MAIEKAWVAVNLFLHHFFFSFFFFLTLFKHFLYQVDYEPRCEAFWRVGGFYLTEEDRKLRKAKEIDESLLEDPIDRFFQYYGAPVLQLRNKLLLPPLPKLKWTYSKPIENDSESADDNSAVARTSKDMSDVKTVQPETSRAVELSILSDNGTIYPLQEYRYRPDVYLELTRERIYGAVIPGKCSIPPFFLLCAMIGKKEAEA